MKSKILTILSLLALSASALAGDPHGGGLSYTVINGPQIQGSIVIKDQLLNGSHLRSFMHCPQLAVPIRSSCPLQSRSCPVRPVSANVAVDESQCVQIGSAKAYLFDKFQLAIEAEVNRTKREIFNIKAVGYTGVAAWVTGGFIGTSEQIGQIKWAAPFRMIDRISTTLFPEVIKGNKIIKTKYYAAFVLITAGMMAMQWGIMQTMSNRNPNNRISQVGMAVLSVQTGNDLSLPYCTKWTDDVVATLGQTLDQLAYDHQAVALNF